MTHIAGSQVFRFKQLTGAEAPFLFQNWPERPDKWTSIRYLNQAFDYVIAPLPKITAEQMAKPFKVDWKRRPEVNGRQMVTF
jgi:hypothetical protein